MTRKLLSKDHENGELFERQLEELGLIARRVPLKKLTNGTHWHITKPGSTGTLEATYDGTSKQLWIEIRANRSASWQEPVIVILQSMQQPGKGATPMSTHPCLVVARS